jgi:hypothetical protein
MISVERVQRPLRPSARSEKCRAKPGATNRNRGKQRRLVVSSDNVQTLRSAYEAFARQDIPEEFIEAGETIIVPTRIRGTGAGGSTESASLHLWRMRDGKAAPFREYPDTPRALQATGQQVPTAV